MHPRFDPLAGPVAVRRLALVFLVACSGAAPTVAAGSHEPVRAQLEAGATGDAHVDQVVELLDAGELEASTSIDAQPSTPDAAPTPGVDASPAPVDAGPPAVDPGPATVCVITSQAAHPDVACPTSATMVWQDMAKGTSGYCGASGWLASRPPSYQVVRFNCPVDAWCSVQSAAGTFTGHCGLAP